VDFEAFRDGRVLAVGWDSLDATRGIVLEAMKRTLEMPVDHLAPAELNASVNAFVAQATHLACVIPPEDQLLAHARHAHRPVFDLLRIHHDVPLVRNHNMLLIGAPGQLMLSLFPKQIVRDQVFTSPVEPPGLLTGQKEQTPVDQPACFVLSAIHVCQYAANLGFVAIQID